MSVQQCWLTCAALVLLLGACRTEEESLALQPAKVEAWRLPLAGPTQPSPRGLTVAPGSNERFVLDTAGRVCVLDEKGVVTRFWRMPDSSVGTPENLTVLADGSVAIPDTHYHQIVIFDWEGRVERTFGSFGRSPGEFIYPVGIAEHPEGDLFICEYGSNDRVQRFQRDGTFVSEFGSFGSERGQFQRPSAIEWRDGLLYISDAANHQVQVFKEGGELVRTIGAGQMAFPYDLELVEDGFWVAEWGAGRISHWSFDGQLLGHWGTAGQGAEQLSTPWGLTVEANRVLVADTGNRRIMAVTW